MNKLSLTVQLACWLLRLSQLTPFRGNGNSFIAGCKTKDGNPYADKFHQAKMEAAHLQRGFFNVDYIRTMFIDHRNKRRDTSLYIWTLFNLTSWYDYWIDQK